MSNVNVGIQLYSVKDEITKYGIDEVFAALHDAGCDSVEFAGFYGIPPMEMKEKLEKYGEKIIVSSRKCGYKIDEKYLGGQVPCSE